MFDVIRNNTDERYTVYDVMRDGGKTWFLIYANNKWDWYIANYYRPVEGAQLS